MNGKVITLWMTGLSGAGKSTIAEALKDKLNCTILDGDVVRNGLCKGLGFSAEDRKENIRRIAEVAKLMNGVGLNIIVACISPYDADRQMAREIVGAPFKLLHVCTPLDVCEQRDVKGLYAKVRSGKLAEFTGISAPYEVPHCAELTINTIDCTVEEAVTKIISQIT
jgi:adenylyl-sulfate kinase